MDDTLYEFWIHRRDMERLYGAERVCYIVGRHDAEAFAAAIGRGGTAIQQTIPVLVRDPSDYPAGDPGELEAVTLHMHTPASGALLDDWHRVTHLTATPYILLTSGDGDCARELHTLRRLQAWLTVPPMDERAIPMLLLIGDAAMPQQDRTCVAELGTVLDQGAVAVVREAQWRDMLADVAAGKARTIVVNDDAEAAHLLVRYWLAACTLADREGTYHELGALHLHTLKQLSDIQTDYSKVLNVAGDVQRRLEIDEQRTAALAIQGAMHRDQTAWIKELEKQYAALERVLVEARGYVERLERGEKEAREYIETLTVRVATLERVHVEAREYIERLERGEEESREYIERLERAEEEAREYIKMLVTRTGGLEHTEEEARVYIETLMARIGGLERAEEEAREYIETLVGRLAEAERDREAGSPQRTHSSR